MTDKDERDLKDLVEKVFVPGYVKFPGVTFDPPLLIEEGYSYHVIPDSEGKKPEGGELLCTGAWFKVYKVKDDE